MTIFFLQNYKCTFKWFKACQKPQKKSPWSEGASLAESWLSGDAEAPLPLAYLSAPPPFFFSCVGGESFHDSVVSAAIVVPINLGVSRVRVLLYDDFPVYT